MQNKKSRVCLIPTGAPDFSTVSTASTASTSEKDIYSFMDYIGGRGKEGREETGRRGMFFDFAREIVGVQPTKKNSLGTHRVPGVMTPTGLRKKRTNRRGDHRSPATVPIYLRLPCVKGGGAKHRRDCYRAKEQPLSRLTPTAPLAQGSRKYTHP